MSVQERFQGPGWEWDQELVKAVDAFEALYPGVVYWGSCGGFSCGPLTHVAYCDVKSVRAPGTIFCFPMTIVVSESEISRGMRQ